jgi:hypothetical protein
LFFLSPEELVNVPRIFLKTVLTGCVEAAKARGVHVITADFLKEIRDKRAEEKPPSLLQKLQQPFARQSAR